MNFLKDSNHIIQKNRKIESGGEKFPIAQSKESELTSSILHECKKMFKKRVENPNILI